MVQVVKVSPAAVPDVQISVRIYAGLLQSGSRLRTSLPAVTPFAVPEADSEFLGSDLFCFLMAGALQNAGDSVAAFPPAKPQRWGFLRFWAGRSGQTCGLEPVDNLAKCIRRGA